MKSRRPLQGALLPQKCSESGDPAGVASPALLGTCGAAGRGLEAETRLRPADGRIRSLKRLFLTQLKTRKRLQH